MSDHENLLATILAIVLILLRWWDSRTAQSKLQDTADKTHSLINGQRGDMLELRVAELTRLAAATQHPDDFASLKQAKIEAAAHQAATAQSDTMDRLHAGGTS